MTVAVAKAVAMIAAVAVAVTVAVEAAAAFLPPPPPWRGTARFSPSAVWPPVVSLSWCPGFPQSVSALYARL